MAAIGTDDIIETWGPGWEKDGDAETDLEKGQQGHEWK